MGTMDSTSFGKGQERSDGSGKEDIFFNNGKADGANKGHVVQSTNPDGTPNYHYVRDVEGNVYIDDSLKQ